MAVGISVPPYDDSLNGKGHKISRDRTFAFFLISSLIWSEITPNHLHILNYEKLNPFDEGGNLMSAAALHTGWW